MNNPLLSAAEQSHIDAARALHDQPYPTLLQPHTAWESLKQRAADIDYWRWFKVAAAILNLAGFTYLIGMFMTYVESFGWHSIYSIGLLLMGIYHLHAVWTMEADDGIKTLLHSTGMYVLVIAY
jgi:hypothetical protein